MLAEYSNHPASELFPMMPEAELQELANDIKNNGLREPITLLNNTILDGRNRYAACRLVSIEPAVTHLSDQEVGSPIQYVSSKNLHRRHLTVAQRAKIGVEMIPLLAEEAKKRELAGKKTDPSRHGDHGIKGSAAEIAGKLVGVDRTTVYRAKAIKEADPDLYKKLGNPDGPSVHAAYDDIQHRPLGHTSNESWNGNAGGRTKGDFHGSRKDKQSEYVIDTERKRAVADGQKARMIDGLSTIAGICRGLAGLDFGMIRASCPEEELDTWISAAKEFRKALQEFVDQLEAK